MIVARLAITLVTLALGASVAHAQEHATEQSGLRHVFDETPVWETDVDLETITLEAPSNLTLCRQGRIVSVGGQREAHMGCWPVTSDGVSALRVPLGPGFLAVRRGTDLTFVGGGATVIHAADRLHVTFDDRMTIRIAGWITAAVGVVASAALLIASVVGTGTRTELAISGAAIAGAGLVVGIALACVNDGIELTVVP